MLLSIQHHQFDVHDMLKELKRLYALISNYWSLPAKINECFVLPITHTKSRMYNTRCHPAFFLCLMEKWNF